MSNALAIGKPGTVIATLAQDYAFGRDFVAAFKTALAPTGAKLVCRGIRAADDDRFHRARTSVSSMRWPRSRAARSSSSTGPAAIRWRALKAMEPERLGIELATGGNILPALVAYKDFPGMEGAAYYYYDIPKNPVNDCAGRREQEALQRRAARFLHLRRLHRGAGRGRRR